MNSMRTFVDWIVCSRNMFLMYLGHLYLIIKYAAKFEDIKLKLLEISEQGNDLEILTKNAPQELWDASTAEQV